MIEDGNNEQNIFTNIAIPNIESSLIIAQSVSGK